MPEFHPWLARLTLSALGIPGRKVPSLTCPLQPLGQFQGEGHIHKLGAAVGLVEACPLCPRQELEVHPPNIVPEGGDVDDPSRGRGLQGT